MLKNKEQKKEGKSHLPSLFQAWLSRPQAGGAVWRKTDPCKQVSCWAGPDSAIHSLFAKLFAQTILFEQSGKSRVCQGLPPPLCPCALRVTANFKGSPQGGNRT